MNEGHLLSRCLLVSVCFLLNARPSASLVARVSSGFGARA